MENDARVYLIELTSSVNDYSYDVIHVVKKLLWRIEDNYIFEFNDR